jgi:hypothetical protein
MGFYGPIAAVCQKRVIASEAKQSRTLETHNDEIAAAR